MGLRLVEVQPIVCWPWHLRVMTDEAVCGERCRDCGRDVASPVATHKAPQVCLYCGMDRGLVELLDYPIGEVSTHDH